MSVNSSFQENYPFISCIRSNDIEYVGIIINFDNSVASIYDISGLKTDHERSKFLELGEVWWWESNRQIPINIFLKQEWIPFRPYLRTFNNKNLTIVHGPVVSLNELNKRRTKRRSITLVKRMP